MSTSPEFAALATTAPRVPTQRGRTQVHAAFPVPTTTRPAVAAASFRPLVEPGADDAGSGAVRARARAAGFAEGFAAGAREAARVAARQAEEVAAQAAQAEAARSAATERALAALATAARALAARQAPVLDRLTDRVQAAAVELAEAILGAELSDAPAGARAALVRALSVPGTTPLAVRMNPADIALLANLPQAAPDGVRLVADPTLAAGDAVAQTAEGEVDARLSAALGRVRAVLAGAA